MSTARHQLAGAPGTGTTIDNMASRVKAHCRINGSTAALLGGFNIAGTRDVALGEHEVTFAAIFASLQYTAVCSMTNGGAGIVEVVGNTVSVSVLWSYNIAGGKSDIAGKNAAFFGDLA